MTDLFIALGANLPGPAGPPAATLHAALGEIAAVPGVDCVSESRFWRTPAFPAGSGPDFVNAAARITATVAPDTLLEALHAIEARMGRTRPGRWAPRAVDLDLLAAGDVVAPDLETVRGWMDLSPTEAARAAPDRLILPHPRLHERAFVLAPLCDVGADWRHPVLDRTARELFAALPAADRAAVVAL